MTMPPGQIPTPFPTPAPGDRPDDSLERKSEIAALRALAEIAGKVVVQDDQGNFGLNVLGLSGVTSSIDDVVVNLDDEYSDGGEAKGKDRTLGNTDAFDLSFLTSGINRLKIKDDGLIGVGTAATGSPDELFHISKTVGAGDVALLIENSFGNVVSSPPTTETASLKFGFGGVNTAAQIQAGKIQDFTTGPDEDAFLAFLVSDNGVLSEAMRLVGGSSVFLGIGTSVPNELVTVEGRISLKDSQATPATIAGYGKVYVKADGDLYFLDPTGTETNLIAGGADSDWTIDGVAQFSAVSGNVGIGPVTAATIDEKLHVNESNDGGDTAMLVENAFTNTASSIDETVSLKFGFGGVNTAGLLRVGKIEDFVGAAGEFNAFMDFSVLADNVATRLIRLMGSNTVVSATPTVTIGSGEAGTLIAGTRSFCRVQLPTGTGSANALEVTHEDGTAPRFKLSGSSTGQYSLRANSSNLSIHHDGVSDFNIIQLNSTLVDIATAGLRLRSPAGSDADFQIVAASGRDATIKFQDSGFTTRWTIFMDNTEDNDLFIETTSLTGGLRIDRGVGALSIGAGIAPNPGPVALIIRAKNTGGGTAAQNIWNITHAKANAAAQVNDTMGHQWLFGSSLAGALAIRMEIGKIEDFTSGANESAFIKWEVKNDGSLAEALRFEGGGGLKIGLYGVTPVVRQTGYTTFLNLVTDRTLDANATSVAELADVLGTLIEDLKALGPISA